MLLVRELDFLALSASFGLRNIDLVFFLRVAIVLCTVEPEVAIHLSPCYIFALEIESAPAIDGRLSLECGFDVIYAILPGDVLCIAHDWMLIGRKGWKSIDCVQFLS